MTCVNMPSMEYPSRIDLTNIQLVGTTEIAQALGITRHALIMRLRRGGIPQPDRRLDGCLVWFMTRELREELSL